MQKIVRNFSLLWAATAIALSVPSSALAATEAEWEAFRSEVRASCQLLAEPMFETMEIIVDPFGSPSYGLALIRGNARGADAQIMAICVYDKATQTAEIGGELPTFLPAAPVAWAAAFAACGPACDALTPLTEEDEATLRGLADRVAATVAEIGMLVDDDAWEPTTREILERALAAPPGGDFVGLTTGERSCTVYWYGFMENAGQVIGHHRCRIEETADGLVITKETGERFRAEIVPAGGGYHIAVGRSYLADHAERNYDAGNPHNAANDNFGNYVAMAFADNGALILIAADLRGFETPDPTFFSVTVIE